MKSAKVAELWHSPQRNHQSAALMMKKSRYLDKIMQIGFIHVNHCSHLGYLSKRQFYKITFIRDVDSVLIGLDWISRYSMRSQLIPGDKSWQPLLFLSSPPLTPGAMLAMQNKTMKKKKSVQY